MNSLARNIYFVLLRAILNSRPIRSKGFKDQVRTLERSKYENRMQGPLIICLGLSLGGKDQWPRLVMEKRKQKGMIRRLLCQLWEKSYNTGKSKEQHVKAKEFNIPL